MSKILNNLQSKLQIVHKFVLRRKKELIGLVILLFLLGVVPLTIYQSTHQQINNSHAISQANCSPPASCTAANSCGGIIIAQKCNGGAVCCYNQGGILTPTPTPGCPGSCLSECTGGAQPIPGVCKNGLTCCFSLGSTPTPMKCSGSCLSECTGGSQPISGHCDNGLVCCNKLSGGGSSPTPTPPQVCAGSCVSECQGAILGHCANGQLCCRSYTPAPVAPTPTSVPHACTGSAGCQPKGICIAANDLKPVPGNCGASPGTVCCGGL